MRTFITRLEVGSDTGSDCSDSPVGASSDSADLHRRSVA